MENINITQLVKNNHVRFDSYRQGHFYYKIENYAVPQDPTPLAENEARKANSETLQFPVPLDDIGTATLLATDKAITFMRWIRKAIQDGTLVNLNK
jgi:hypothetical protein